MEWVLKHCRNLELTRWNYDKYSNGPWTLRNVRHDFCSRKHQDVKYNEDYDSEALVEGEFEWDSNDDNVLNSKDMIQKRFHINISFLGFRPFREIILFDESLERGVAYHLKSSKIQYLGNFFPQYDMIQYIEASFPYTPCWMLDGRVSW